MHSQPASDAVKPRLLWATAAVGLVGLLLWFFTPEHASEGKEELSAGSEALAAADSGGAAGSGQGLQALPAILKRTPQMEAAEAADELSPEELRQVEQAVQQATEAFQRMEMANTRLVMRTERVNGLSLLAVISRPSNEQIGAALHEISKLLDSLRASSTIENAVRVRAGDVYFAYTRFSDACKVVIATNRESQTSFRLMHIAGEHMLSFDPESDRIEMNSDGIIFEPISDETGLARYGYLRQADLEESGSVSSSPDR